MTAVITIAGIVLWCATYALAKSYASVWRGVGAAFAFAFMETCMLPLSDFFVMLLVLMPAGVLGGIMGRRALKERDMTEAERIFAQRARDEANQRWNEW